MNRVLMIILLTLSGCSNFSISNINQPTPSAWEAWFRKGTTYLEIKKAMLECGAPHSEVSRFIYESAGINGIDEQMNHIFLVGACMEKAGFVNRGRSFEQACTDSNFPERRSYPACRPGAAIPQRSVERRLNSWLCKLETDREYCLKHAFNPRGCDDPRKDYDNPPPECRP
jgi:hypothetical protein